MRSIFRGSLLIALGVIMLTLVFSRNAHAATEPSDVHIMDLRSSALISALAEENLEPNPKDDTKLFSWFCTENFILGFLGYAFFICIAVLAIRYPIDTSEEFKIAMRNVALHTTAAIGAGFVTVLFQLNQPLDAFLTGTAFLALAQSFGPKSLRLTEES